MTGAELDIAGWWTALGASFAAVEIAGILTGRAARLERKNLGRKAMKLAYVHVAPPLGGSLGKGRALHALLYLPLVSLAGLALALCGAIALTIFPKYWTLEANAQLYHAFNAPYYVGLAAAYVATLFTLGHYFSAKCRACSPEEN